MINVVPGDLFLTNRAELVLQFINLVFNRLYLTILRIIPALQVTDFFIISGIIRIQFVHLPFQPVFRPLGLSQLILQLFKLCFGLRHVDH